MADEEHLRMLRRGMMPWDAWRKEHAGIVPDLTEADLTGAYLVGTNLGGANLTEASFGGANLTEANFSGADLTGAYLSRAYLGGTNLGGANLTGAILNRAILSGADLKDANFQDAFLQESILSNLDLSSCKGLETCTHLGPSSVDVRTLERSGKLPLAFLRGVGLPDKLIEYLPSLLNQPIQHYSCFISYSSKDEGFAQRLYADLQNKGVRCWFAPEDLKIGAELRPTFDEAIRIRDKLLIVLSASSLQRPWVKREVEQALDEEMRSGQTKLFPVRLDDAIFDVTAGWATDVQRRNIGDFRRWKEHDTYQKALDRLLRCLWVEAA